MKAVVMHEAALKAQAKKMNVESLRSGEQSGDSAEVKIAKVTIFNFKVTCYTPIFIFLNLWKYLRHRLNMELDVQSLFRLHSCTTAVLIG